MSDKPTRVFRTSAGTFELIEREDRCSALNLSTGAVHVFNSLDACQEALRTHPHDLPTLNDDDIRPPAEGLCVCGDPADTFLDGEPFPLCRDCAAFITGEDDHLYPDIIW